MYQQLIKTGDLQVIKDQYKIETKLDLINKDVLKSITNNMYRPPKKGELSQSSSTQGKGLSNKLC